MAQLFKLTSQDKVELTPQLQMASTFFSRARGLLGKMKLDENEALWIVPCNNIHTFFMRFPIDCIFVSKNMEVKKIFRNVGPWKILGPFFSLHSVIEASAGFVERKNINIGDQLYVVH